MTIATQGNVANFVQTEQLVEVEGPKGAAVSSYVQVRDNNPSTPSSRRPHMKQTLARPLTCIPP